MGVFDDSLKVKAHSDYGRARNKAFFNDVIHKIFNKNNELFRLDEVKYLLSPHGMAYRGIKPIPLAQIVGSEGRYQDFDKDFMPRKEHERSRWENLDMAAMKDVKLPPISVYKIGDFYFVKDGNHRVSVARRLEQEFIDAEVVELFTKVKLEEISEKDLLLAESYRYFLDKTKFDEIFPGMEIKLTNPWGYYRLIEHINNYRHISGEKEKKEIPWKEAVKRWYQELYLNVTRLIKRRKVLRRFPGREAGDLYIWVMDHWHYLKEKSGDIQLEEALDDYSTKYGSGKLARLYFRVKEWLFEILHRD